MTSRSDLPDWPKLMSISMAADYFSLSENSFRALGLAPISVGKRVLYDRAALDRYANRLSGVPLEANERAQASAEVERAFLERRQRA